MAVTVAVALDLDAALCLAALERGLAQNTVLAYRRRLRGFLAFLEERGLAPEEVEHDDVGAFLDWLEARGASESTRRQALMAVRCAFEASLDDGDTARDPTENVQGPRIGLTLPRVPTLAEVESVLAAPPESSRIGRRDRAALETLYATGARVSELCGADVRDYREGALRLRGKGGRERIVPVGRHARAALAAHLADKRSAKPERCVSPTAPLVASRTGRRLTRDRVLRLLARACGAAGVAPFSPHALRHACATHVLAGGAGLREVAELLGHARLTTTTLYTHLDADRLVGVHSRCHPRSTFSGSS